MSLTDTTYRQSSHPAITVAVPAYNAEAFIGECIESVLAQTFTDFELLIVDDGSEDRTCEVISKYTDPRIRLIRNPHHFVKSRNTLLDQAHGTYIAFIDADDRMLPNRLQIQYDYMEANPGIDVLGGGVLAFGSSKGTFCSRPGITGRAITLDEMIRGNQLYNPTTMIRRESLEQHGIRCPEAYTYASDYALWMQMLYKGLHLENIDQILTEYRFSKGQISNRKQKEQAECARLIKAEAIRFRTNGFNEAPTDLTRLHIPVTGNRLTLIIPFLNEGEEVRNTVASAREQAAANVDIMVINDASDDGYDYRAELEPYGVTYIRNKERIGVAASRDLGVKLCTTPYFLLLDAHMRFYESRWPGRITELLDKDDRCILCCQTRYLSKNLQTGEVIDASKSVTSFGAYMPCVRGNYLPDIRWNSVETCPGKDIEPVGCILGAGYAGSKRYWQYLRGLEGLLYYGSDESYISMKVWREGGRCLLLKDTVIGHIYRNTSPFRHFSEAEVYNHLWIASLLFPPSWRCLSMATALYKDRKTFRQAYGLLKKNETLYKELRSYYQSIFTVPFKNLLPLHRKITSAQQESIRRKTEMLPRLTDFLLRHEPDHCGILTGKAGHLIWFSHYARYTQDSQWDKTILYLWERIQESVKAERLPNNFAEGLAGIGWTLFYLYENGFLDQLPEIVLEQIDRQMVCLNPEQITDSTFLHGAGGLLAYCLLRCRYAAQQGQPAPWSEHWLKKLTQRATLMLEEENVELASLHFAMQWLARTRNPDEKDDFPPALHDWMTFTDYLPENEEFWEPGLAGNVINSHLQAMLIKETLDSLYQFNA